MKVKDKFIYLLKIFLLWIILQYRVHISRCFRADTPTIIIRYFKYLKIKDSVVKLIANDLFIEDHPNKKNKYNLRHWEQGLKMKASIRVLSKAEVVYPQYFIDSLIRKFFRDIRANEEIYSWSTKEYSRLLLQPNISTKSLLSQIDWAIATQKTKNHWGGGIYLIAIDNITSLFLHPNLDEKSLLILANSNDKYIRNMVTKNPKCPREARITIALLNSNVGI